MRRVLWIGVLGLLPAFGLLAGRSRGEDAPARAPGTIELKGNPDGLGEVQVQEAFPGLTFQRPVFIGSPPDAVERFYVAEQDGVIRSFERKADAGKVRVFLDLKDRVLAGHVEEGLLGVAFHPEFRRNGMVYVAYTADKPARIVVSRFTAPGSRAFARQGSEQVVLTERKPAGGNNGGWLAFGPEGMLYVSLGDGGKEGDPDGNAQNLGSRLGKILRLDVGEKKAFSVPSDNPFLEVAGARPEIWALGFRNARRFSFDPLSGDLWAGDIGVNAVEELDLVARGGNYGWNLREGRQVFKAGAVVGSVADPVLEIPHADGRFITGGVVYRGQKLHGLAGAYLYGDQETGNLWALRWDGNLVKENRLLARGVRVTAFGTDTAGEVLLTASDGKVYTLAPGPESATTPKFPDRLSETGIFTDLAKLTPHPSLVPYEVNVPLWSDGAFKTRWIMLPGQERIRVLADGRFEFPRGTLFVKNFHHGDPAQGGRRLETRLFVNGEQGWAGYTYVWNDEQTDALLLDGRATRSLAGTGEHEGATITWTFPSRSDCMSCHTEVAGRVLGFTALQLDGVPPGSALSANQLVRLVNLGLFQEQLAPSGKGFPQWTSEAGATEAGLRAYLDANCAMCHQPGGPGNANIDLRWGTPLAKTNLVDRRPGQWDLGVTGARLLLPGSPERSLLLLRMQRTDERSMPIVGHNRPDELAITRLEAWIKGLK